MSFKREAITDYHIRTAERPGRSRSGGVAMLQSSVPLARAAAVEMRGAHRGLGRGVEKVKTRSTGQTVAQSKYSAKISK